MENLELAYALTNQYLFQEAKNNITDLSYYFSVNPSTSGNMLIEQLVEAVKNYDLASMDLPLFQSIISKAGKNEQEANKILNDIRRWKSYTKEQIEPARKYLQDVCASVIIQKASRLHQDHPSEYLKYLRNIDFKTADLDIFSPKKFNEFDINSIIADQANNFIETPFSWLNESFAPHNGMPRNQMCIICAPPGVGKSLISMQLACHFALTGHRVLYIALGDLNQRDFITRMGAQWSGLSFADTYNNLGAVYQGLSQALGNNLEISISPAGKVSADDIVNYVKTSKFDPEIIFTDYDGNCKGANDSESMYNNFGSIYEKLNEIVLMDKLLFVCAQPKINTWSNPTIEMQDIGESSKKQQTADMIIGIGREIDSPNHLHTIKIVKSRRGEEGIKAYTIRLNNGRFVDLKYKALYDQLKNIQDKRHFTEADINGMISQYESNLNQINNSVKSYQASPSHNSNNSSIRSSGPSPF